MPFAARVLDPTAHPGTVAGPGVPTVLITGLPAAVAGDQHVCALAPVPHPPTPFPTGSLTVYIGGRPALRVGDVSGCGAPILVGAATVELG
jgi:uncharacterized Zn-binding protein involved in type VI secretion